MKPLDWPLDWLIALRQIHQERRLHVAAEALGLTPQALSRNIREFESKLGYPLLERHPHGVTLTQAAQKLLSQADDLLHRIEFLPAQLQHIQRQEISLGFVDALHVPTLAQLTWHWMQTWPNSYLKVYDSSPEEIDRQVQNGNWHIGITIYPVNHPEMACVELPPSPYIIVGAQPGQSSWQTLKYITMDDYHQRQYWLNQHWNETLYPRQRILSLNSPSTAIRLCQTGMGALYIPQLMVLEELRQQQLHMIATPPHYHEHRLYLLYHRQFTDFSPVHTLLVLLKEHLIPSDGP